MTTATSDHVLHSDTPSRGALRLTRRGRLVVLLALLVLALVAFGLGRLGSSAAATDSGAPAAPVGYAATTVHVGETLWTVAKRVAPGHDPRDVIAQIQELNNLHGGAIQVGQQLLLPHVA